MNVTRHYYKNIPTSMTDFEVFYNNVASELPDNCVVVEVGVADGRSALYLADRLNEMGKKFKMYMIDNLDYGHMDQANTILTNIHKSGFTCIDFYHTGSLDSSCKFNDNSLDFVFIDASHKYQETKADILLWSRKVKDGCILAGHDYTSPENPEVKQAVDEIIPSEILNVENTEQGNGVWWFRKENNLKLK